MIEFFARLGGIGSLLRVSRLHGIVNFLRTFHLTHTISISFC